MRGLLGIALRNLFLRREQGMLLFAVIAAASGVLVGVMSLSAGVAATQKDVVTTFLSGELNVGGFFKVHPDSISPVVGDAARVRAVVEPLVPDGCLLRERGRGQATAGAGRHRVRSYVVALDVEGEGAALRRFKVKDGALETLARPRTVALSTQLAGRLHVRLGDMATLFTQTVGGQRNALDVEVVAITERAGLLGESAGILVSNATLRELDGYRPGSAGVLQVACAGADGDMLDVDGLAGQLRDSLRQAGFTVLPPAREAYGDKLSPLLREGWAGQRVDVTTWEDESAFLGFISAGLAALTVLVGAITLAVVMMGLFVSLSVAVRERTREVGTLRAVGMHRRSVVGMFMLEGMLLGAVSSGLGALVATGVCVLLRDAISLPEALSGFLFSDTLPLAPGPGHVVAAVILATVGATLASIIPAARASSLSPRSAMDSL
ncbi:ABC transporter permease [Myxococcus sp. AM009]|uniref:ABC transporter permease n=1 Tax=unclassified Myxococcus TaxID=2648731 RepID=UPI001595284A|nr:MULTISPECIES: FtsX-like permease family protein [unclassified Myxococcus]NVJ02823.1 ABC transporter permease [Myxococcus sp. AM009]NVJ14166.1 ABC transporter permease [Myxococcus sp. AM010]